jgi:hypothetical protein
MLKGGVGVNVKIAIVGSRKFYNCETVKKHLFYVLAKEQLSLSDIMLVSGGAKGVDTCAEQIAKEFGLSILIHFPNYRKFGKIAPLKRNDLIVKNSDIVIAFPTNNSRGTYDTIKKAKRKKKKVYVFNVEPSFIF